SRTLPIKEDNPMQPRQRFMLSAVVSAIVFAIGYAVAVVIPGAGDTTTADYAKFYNSDSKMAVAMVLFFVLIGGCLLMLWFFNELRQRLPDTLLTRIGYTAAIIGVVALPIGAGILGGPGGGKQGGGIDYAGTPVAAAFAQAGLGIMLGVGMVAFALAALLMSIAARRSGLISRQAGVAGIVLAVLTAGSYFWFPGYAFVLWVLVVGLAAGKESEVPTAHAATLATHSSGA
ncbi:MAG: hypothetical protein ACRDG3_09740, partial [Tepidiformaceae bacterium]